MNRVQPLQSENVTQKLQIACDTSTIFKISLVVLGLLLIGGAVASHMYQVNAIAVYTMGGAGGFLILATAIGSAIQWRSHKPAESSNKRSKKIESKAPVLREVSFAPPEVIARLPQFLQKLVSHIPYKSFLAPKTIQDFPETCDGPLLFYSDPTRDGIYMRLQVEHIPIDSDFDYAKEYERNGWRMFERVTKGSSQEPFTIEIIAYSTEFNDWHLAVKEGTYIMHRNAPFETSKVLVPNVAGFRFVNRPPSEDKGNVLNTLPSEELIKKFTDTENQDCLKHKEGDYYSENRWHLAWLLIRLLKGQKLEIRELNTNKIPNFIEPPLGYWKVFIEKS